MIRAGAMLDLVVADQQTERLATQGTELLGVDLFKQQALIEIRSPLEVANDLVPGNGQHADLRERRPVRRIRQVLQAAPSRLEPLESRRVQDGIHLFAD